MTNHSNNTKPSLVINVSEQTFAAEVIEKSKQIPVVVDFWAAWCAPCRTLGPILERLAVEFQGTFILAKLDVDRNQRLSQQYGVQGIPAVKAFRHGRVVSEFVGAIPEPKVREFLRQLIPNEADRLAAQGAAAEGQNQMGLAETAYVQALGKQADHPLAMLGLARIRLRQGRVGEAEKLLRGLPPTAPGAAEAQRLLIRARWQTEASQLESAVHLGAADKEAPGEKTLGLAERIALGKLRLSQGRDTEGLDLLLGVVRADRSFENGAARKAMVEAFALLGDENPLTITYRRQLSNALF